MCPDISPVRVVLARAIILLHFLIGVLMAGSVSAQEDTTPPVLVDFKMSPVVFDTSQGDVPIDICTTVADDLSGVQFLTILGRLPHSSFGFLDKGFQLPGPTVAYEKCFTAIAPLGTPEGVYGIEIMLEDRLGNERYYIHPLSTCNGNGAPCAAAEDLCALGFPCSLENRFLGSSPDTDGDGIPDIADNCPDVSNPDQADRDLDLIGDACDPFPDDSDNEQAQCEVDLAQRESELAQCLANVVPDQDGDGEADATDACPNTPEGAEVDQAGCSLTQFCAAIDATTKLGNTICKNSDWRNDNPLAASNKGDCRVKKGDPGRADDLCVPRL
jgi:hypothetical protein